MTKKAESADSSVREQTSDVEPDTKQSASSASSASESNECVQNGADLVGQERTVATKAAAWPGDDRKEKRVRELRPGGLELERRDGRRGGAEQTDTSVGSGAEPDAASRRTGQELCELYQDVPCHVTCRGRSVEYIQDQAVQVPRALQFGKLDLAACLVDRHHRRRVVLATS